MFLKGTSSACRSRPHLVQVHQESHIAAQVSCQFAVFGAEQESLRRPVGALLLPGCVHFFHPFSAVVQHHFAVPWREMEIKKYSKPEPKKKTTSAPSSGSASCNLSRCISAVLCGFRSVLTKSLITPAGELNTPNVVFKPLKVSVPCEALETSRRH